MEIELSYSYSILSFWRKAILFLVWTGVVNGMVNTPDWETGAGNAGYDEMDSIAEWLLEDVMEWETPMPEPDDPEELQKKAGSGTDWSVIPSDLDISIVGYNNRVFPARGYINRAHPTLDTTVPPPDRFSLLF